MSSSVLKLLLPLGAAAAWLVLLLLLPGSVPPSPLAQAEVGIALGKLGRYAEGTSLLNQAMAREPRLFRAHFGLAMLDYQAKRYAEAERELRMALECPGATPDSLFMLGVILQSQNRLTEALPIYQGLVAKLPNEPNYVYNLGMLARQMGDAPSARRHLSTYLRLAPQAADRRSVEQVLATLKGV